MGDLLKEAIADAKAVRETALANAKMALEEAFTPQLRNMLSAKLKEDEFEDEEEFGGEEEDPLAALDSGVSYEDDEIPGEEGGDAVDINIDADGAEDLGGVEDLGLGGEEEPEVEEEGIIEINGIKYAPVQQETEFPQLGEAEGDEEDTDNLDLESVIKELESEITEGNAEDKDNAYSEGDPGEDPNHQAGKSGDMHESENPEDADNAHSETAETPDGGGDDGYLAENEEEEDDDVEIDESIFTEGEDEDEEIEEQSDSSQIGSGTGVKQASGSDEEDPQGNKLSEVQSQLKEYKQAVSFLKDKLHEVNILNAKLLFTNKLFKEFALDNNQKLKVVETFDRTQSTREIKLVYSTLAEQFSDNGSIKKKSIKESASSAVKSTKPSKQSQKVITEEDNVANRFKKLAGIVNG